VADGVQAMFLAAEDRFAGKHSGSLGEVDTHAQQVWTNNQAEAIKAFRSAWNGQDSPKNNVQDFGTAATIIGAGLMVFAGIVLALKIKMIVQLVLPAIQIAQAIATAVVTFGASLAEISLFKQISNIIIDQLIDIALQAILNG
jgi:hypothetical protein